MYTPLLASTEKFGSACIASMSCWSISIWIFASMVLNRSDTGSHK